MIKNDSYSVRKKVSIIVTAYNPSIDSFKRNLQSYFDQVEMVVICDNSDIPEVQEQVCLLAGKFKNVILLSMGGNVGIAAAQNFGVNYAIKSGFEYFIEIDQDSILPSDYVSKIFISYSEAMSQGCNVAGIGPLAVRISDGFIYHGRGKKKGIIPVDKTLSSGFFFSKNAFEKVGQKDESLFIDFVDWDWCWRCKQFGLTVYVDTGLRINHMLGGGHKKIFLWEFGMPAPVRHYYQYRNSFYLLFRSYVPFTWKLKRIVINIIKLPLYSFFVGDGKVRRKYIVKAFKDVFKKKVGKIQP